MRTSRKWHVVSNCNFLSLFYELNSSVCVLIAEDLDVDVDVDVEDMEDVDVEDVEEGTDCLLGDLEWSSSSVSDWDERASWRSGGSTDEGYSSASLRRLMPPSTSATATAQENQPSPKTSPVLRRL